MTMKFTNNAKTTLSANLLDGVANFTAATGDGNLFPLVSSPDTFYITVSDGSGNYEVMQCTSRTSGSPDYFVVTRNIDSNVSPGSQDWALGDSVELRICAEVLAEIEAHDHDTVYSPITHETVHDSYYVEVAGDTMTGPLHTVTPATNETGDLAVNAEWADTNYSPYEVACAIPDTILNGAIFMSIVFTRDVRFLTDLSDSQADAGTAPSGSSYVLTIYRNGVSIGTITWSSGSTTGAFSFSTDKDFAAGDVLRISGSATTSGISDVSVTVVGKMLF